MKKNNTILIIGAKSDIALAIAYKFASKGWDLQLAARNASELENVSEDLKIRYENNVTTYEFDILNFNTYKEFIDSLNCLPEVVICAGRILGNQKENEKDLFNSSLIMKTNYLGPSLLLGEIANHFEKRGSGSIIGISSVSGERGRASNYIYGSGKSGFSAFLSGLRNRLHKSNVNVLTVLPGFVKTKMLKEIPPKLVTNTPKSIGNIIYNNRFRSKVIYPFPWNYIFLVIKLIPEKIFKRLNL